MSTNNDNTGALLARCREIGTSTWSDALDDMDIDGVVNGIVRRNGCGRFAALAATARQSAAELGGYERSVIGVGEIIDAVGPGEALMVDIGGAPVSTFGGLAAIAAAAKGVAAVVIDGGSRDLEDIRGTGLWVASRHMTPRTGKRRLKLESLHEPVTIGGVLVASGDLVIGDDTGIVVVPKAEIERALEIATSKLKTDLAVEVEVKAGRSFREAARSAKYL